MFRLIKEYPLQAGLFLFNTGIFAWLQTTSSAILAQLGLKEPLTQYIPEPILALTVSAFRALRLRPSGAIPSTFLDRHSPF